MPEIPKTEAELIGWLSNFKDNFPVVAESLGFTAQEVQTAVNDCETAYFTIFASQTFYTHSRSWNGFKRDLMRISPDVRLAPPVYTKLPPAPAQFSDSNALKRLNRVVRRAKLQANFNSAIAAQLQIVEKSRKTRPAPNEAKPQVKALSKTGGIVVIEWVKNGFSGVLVESMRGAETDFSYLDKDTHSPFIDTRPPLVPNQPEIRRYRLIYLLKDKKVGFYSNILEVTVGNF